MIFGIHSTIWLFAPAAALLALKVLVAFHSESLDILEGQEMTNLALEEVETTQYNRVGAGLSMVEETTDKIATKMVKTKREYTEHTKRMTEMKAQGIGLFIGETSQSFSEFIQTLGERFEAN